MAQLPVEFLYCLHPSQFPPPSTQESCIGVGFDMCVREIRTLATSVYITVDDKDVNTVWCAHPIRTLARILGMLA